MDVYKFKLQTFTNIGTGTDTLQRNTRKIDQMHFIN